MNATPLTARNATAADLVAILNTQKARKLDVVAPARAISSRDGLLVVEGTQAQLSDEGVDLTDGTYRPTAVFDDGLSEKLHIPRQFLRFLREDRPDILDGVINGLLHGGGDLTVPSAPGFAGLPASSVPQLRYPPDSRAFLLRLFRGDDGSEGVARAMMSDRYSLSMDNLDVLTAVMKGIQDAGVNVISRVSDLSERGMRVRFEAPDVYTQAPRLLDGYRSPFDGDGAARRAGSFDALRQQYGAHHIFEQKDAPIAFIGFDFRNSETGGGAYWLTPVVEMVKCTNGWVMKKQGLRKAHLGSKLELGTVRPTLDTLRKAGQLVTAETRDAVSQWLTKGYLEQLIAGLEEKAGQPVASPSETVPAIVAGLGFTEDEQKGVLDMFVLGGQATAGGLAQAVSAFAQTVDDVDRAYELELKTVDALDVAARQ